MFLFSGLILRQLLITTLRKLGRSHYLHPHDAISFFPLAFTGMCCVLALSGQAPSLHVNIFSNTHVVGEYICGG
jgi:hypothetical protein